jgi:hypothetical protein
MVFILGNTYDLSIDAKGYRVFSFLRAEIDLTNG